MLSRFRTCRRGNIAMMFGLLLAPTVAAVGFGVDFVQSQHVRAAVTEASDAAVLAVARARLTDKTLTDSEARALARKVFDLHAPGFADASIDSFDITFDPENDVYAVSVGARVATRFMRVAGAEYAPVRAYSEAVVAPPNALEAVLVLDTTGSMEGAKLTALKSAARSLVDTVMSDNENVKIGVVPFANYVNVGVSRRGEPWLDAPADEVRRSYDCWNTYPDETRTNCRTIHTTCTSTNDGVTTSRPCTRQQCDVNRGEPVERCEWRTHRRTWNGCVGSRNAPYDVQDSDFATRKVPGLLDVSCAEELLPLTADQSVVEDKLDAMRARGETYIPAGLTWGLRVVSSGAPFTEGKPLDALRAEGGVKTMVLMTDGKNTKSARYPDHNGGDVRAANDKTEDLCAEVKASGVVVYTIAFEVSDTPTKRLLRDCASDPENFFDATDASQLVTAFEDIAASLQEIALAK